MAATLGRTGMMDAEKPVLPPLWHWLYGKSAPDRAALRVDGMPRESALLPPVDLPRRMWASSALQFHSDLYVGDKVCRVSEVADVALKQGRSGDLVFVETVHTLTSPRGAALTERHTMVFRGLEEKPAAESLQGGSSAPAARRDTEKRPLPEPEYSREIVADEILLFRYSALTFNSHRIHYDRPYATQTEGYPGLVVHGPLLATLLLDFVAHSFPDRRIRAFSFKAVNPVFDLHPFLLNTRLDTIEDKRFAAWVTDNGGKVCMSAEGMLE